MNDMVLCLERLHKLLNKWHELSKEIPPLCETETVRERYARLDSMVAEIVQEEVKSLVQSERQHLPHP